MPLTSKGQEILKNFVSEYGEKKGEAYFYASRNAGKISGVDAADMSSAGFFELKRLFDKWIDEERGEPEHADDVEFTAAERRELAESGAAMEDGSYPIRNRKDLHDAMEAIGRADHPEAVKAHIRKRAKALGLEKELSPAFDRHANDSQIVDFGPKSTRKYDGNGFMHVRCHVSKACVNPYRGDEIPGWERLGLDRDKIYNLFRDPAELAQGAETFNNVPLMMGHPSGGVTSADEHLDKIGTISNPEFVHPYLDADVTVWNDTPIAGIETDTQRELSSSYAYTPVMEPGEFQGTRYDGVMRGIKANHVALVPVGRAGSDVMVGDAALDFIEGGDFLMALKPRVSARSVLARGAIVSTIRPLLAADAKLEMTGINTVLNAIDGKNWLRQKPRLATAIMGALRKVKLAMDEKEAEEKVNEALDSLDDEGADDGELEEETGAEDESETEEEAERRKEQRAKDRARDIDCASDEEPETEEERKDRMEARKEAKDRRAKDKRMGKDAEPEEREKAEEEHKAEDAKAWDARMKARDARRARDRRPAMDAATVRQIEQRTENRVIARLNSIRAAQDDVRPYIGEYVGAADSAEEIYRYALDQAGIENADIKDVAALRRMVSMLPKPGIELQDHVPGAQFAADSAGGDAWLKKYGIGA